MRTRRCHATNAATCARGRQAADLALAPGPAERRTCPPGPGLAVDEAPVTVTASSVPATHFGACCGTYRARGFRVDMSVVRQGSTYAAMERGAPSHEIEVELVDVRERPCAGAVLQSLLMKLLGFCTDHATGYAA